MGIIWNSKQIILVNSDIFATRWFSVKKFKTNLFGQESPSQLIRCWHCTAASKWEVLLAIIVLFGL